MQNKNCCDCYNDYNEWADGEYEFHYLDKNGDKIIKRFVTGAEYKQYLCAFHLLARINTIALKLDNNRHYGVSFVRLGK